MTFNQLKQFITGKMRMSHIYQPVMIKTLLKHHGACHEENIAKSLLLFDPSQIEYYINITNNMVGKVLRSHGIVSRDRKSKMYFLEGFNHLTKEEIQVLDSLCIEKLENFLNKRGDKIFNHRKKSSGYISGTIRYEVLKRARFRCELCGISADEKALEVDHILPRNHGGTDDIENLQALCYSCNAMKRDRDDTDFRKIKNSYKDYNNNCVFCNLDSSRIIDENRLSLVILDKYPVTKKHLLIIPKRHVSSYFDLGQPEINAIHYLANKWKKQIEREDNNVSGFNMGINDGKDAGQTIFHVHIHLIPRRHGDLDFPEGGVRGVIPEKRRYVSV